MSRKYCEQPGCQARTCRDALQLGERFCQEHFEKFLHRADAKSDTSEPAFEVSNPEEARQALQKAITEACNDYVEYMNVYCRYGQLRGLDTRVEVGFIQHCSAGELDGIMLIESSVSQTIK